MDTIDLVLLIIGIPCAAILSGMAGRYCQRRYWKLDRPYGERVAAMY